MCLMCGLWVMPPLCGIVDGKTRMWNVGSWCDQKEVAQTWNEVGCVWLGKEPPCVIEGGDEAMCVPVVNSPLPKDECLMPVTVLWLNLELGLDPWK